MDMALAALGAPPQRVGIIGGGISGLSCARQLKALGIEAVIFDTGKRAPGGRASSRFFAGAPADHAVQYISAPRGQACLTRLPLTRAGLAVRWHGIPIKPPFVPAAHDVWRLPRRDGGGWGAAPVGRGARRHARL